MASKQIRDISCDDLVERWTQYVLRIAEEANFIAAHRSRFRTIERWLFRTRHCRIANRSIQAYGWISHLWITEALMYMRRELDDQHGTINLTQLLHEIEARTDALPGLRVEEIVADRRALTTQCKDTLPFAQQQKANRAPMDDPFVSLSQIDTSLDAIFQLVKKLHRLFTGKTLRFQGLKPDPGFLQAFTVPWFRPKGRMRRDIDECARMANR
jgi:hypothetical protein